MLLLLSIKPFLLTFSFIFLLLGSLVDTTYALGHFCPYGGLVNFCKCAKNIWKESTLSYHSFLFNVGYLFIYCYFLCCSSPPCVVFHFCFLNLMLILILYLTHVSYFHQFLLLEFFFILIVCLLVCEGSLLLLCFYYELPFFLLSKLSFTDNFSLPLWNQNQNNNEA